MLLDQNILEEVARIGCGTVRNSAKFGWCDAYDHIRATWDYPFEDYSKGGQTVDKKRMQEYQATTPDLIRYLPPKGAPSLPLPDIKYALTKIDKSIFDDLPLEVKIPIVSSVAALPMKWAPSRSGGAAHMLRTSPSGGARHPSELYLLVINIPGFKQGVYHISIGTKDMRFMSDLPDNSIIRQQLPGAYRLPAEPKAIFVISSCFERNMYRYREPRTLRTIYYDAGHLGGLIESLLNNGTTVAHGHQGFHDSFLADLILNSYAQQQPFPLEKHQNGDKFFLSCPGTLVETIPRGDTLRKRRTTLVPQKGRIDFEQLSQILHAGLKKLSDFRPS